MNMSAKLLFVIILLAGGNSWATGNLSSGFHTPQNSSLVVTIWITPSFVGQTPEVCKTVKVRPLKMLKDMVTSTTSSSTDTVDIELVAMQLQTIDPVDISPGQVATIYIRNTELQAQTYHLEFLVEPPIAHEVCGAKASAQVLLDGVVPVGAPVDLSDNFKATSPETGAMDR
jgi:hypothetical protein